MYIINKDKTQFLNIEQVLTMYIGADDVSIKADFVNGKGCQVARYNSHSEAVMAIEMLGNAVAVGRSDVFFFPDDKEIQARMITQKQKTYHSAGKKTKGHGGS